MKKKLALIFCFFVLLSANAQNITIINDLGLPPEEIMALRDRITDKVDELQDAIKRMAMIDRSMSHSSKEELRRITLKLFIGEGKDYPARIPIAYGGFKDTTMRGVQMSVMPSKRFKNKKIKYPMPDYFRGLIKKSEDPQYIYKQIIIEAAEGVRVDNFTKVGDGQYMATATILQHFSGYNGEGKIKYEDTTKKTITIYMNRIEEISPEGLLTHWIVLLGDMDCNDIW